MGRVTGRRPLLVVVNGLPGSGKSTLARRYAAGHLDAVVVDVDAVRAATQPDPLSHEAGLRAREVAAAQVREHLGAGRDVVVPQLLVRPDFLAVLSDVARDAGADLRHVVLLAGPDVVRSRLATRQAASARPEHALAARLLVAAAGPEPVDGTEADTTLDTLRAPVRARRDDGRTTWDPPRRCPWRGRPHLCGFCRSDLRPGSVERAAVAPGGPLPSDAWGVGSSRARSSSSWPLLR